MLLPDLYFKDVPSIKIEDLEQNNIKGIAIDVDNTLIDNRQEMSNEIENWVSMVKNAGYLICILSNSNKIKKISKVANALKIDYIMYAKKPLKSGYQKIIKKFQLPPENVAVIGDQVFTDVLGANLMKMVSIYVEPISKKEYWYTKWKRPLEKMILKLYKREESK